ncbi:MAG: hypothetical protein KG075_04930 [Alphaproteobacteria bacterium]|nr:hypothetical protein [Alphaproteobacteria bacterium]
MWLQKTGNIFPTKASPVSAALYASAISQALRHELGETQNAVKIVARWTGASERTVKNWFAARCGPSGEHLISLAQHSSDVLEVLLLLTGHEHRVSSAKLDLIKTRLNELLQLLE